jgi:hypothetical protein
MVHRTWAKFANGGGPRLRSSVGATMDLSGKAGVWPIGVDLWTAGKWPIYRGCGAHNDGVREGGVIAASRFTEHWVLVGPLSDIG